jgi:MFS family permease
MRLPAVGVYASAPFLGKLADSRGPRLSLALSFVLLLIGYLGIRGVYDASEDNTEPVKGGTLFILILFGLLSGIGGDAGYSAALNTIAKSFPSRIVSSNSGSTTLTMLTPLLGIENDCNRNRHLRLWVIGFPFFYDRAHYLPGKHFRFPAHPSGRDGHPDDTWLVPHSPLSISRTHNTNDHRERQSRRTRRYELHPG